MSASINIHFWNSPVGEMILGEFEGKLCMADWRHRKMRDAVDKRLQSKLNAQYVEQDSLILEQTRIELSEYFSGDRKEFDVPICFAGSDFQKSVWQALVEIPFGKTRTYLQLSRQLGDEKAIRAVAAANGANAISIIVPCHRIIGSDGSLIGYAGGVSTKKKLLQLERADVMDQISLF